MPNVVMVVFDQLPTTSLLDENRQIDRDLYPNFARLAATSTWHRNAATVYQTTHLAIPSLLTYYWLRARIDHYVHEMDNLVEDFVEAQGGAPPVAA